MDETFSDHDRPIVIPAALDSGTNELEKQTSANSNTIDITSETGRDLIFSWYPQRYYAWKQQLPQIFIECTRTCAV